MAQNPANLAPICARLDELLALEKFNDIALNGLQLEGRESVSRVVAAVDISRDLLRHSQCQAGDLMLVHHGFFWGQALALSGPHGGLVREMFEKEVSLYAAHLPLDAHPEFGNNQLLAQEIGLESLKSSGDYRGVPIGRQGLNSKGLSLEDISEKLEGLPGMASSLNLGFGPKVPEKVLIMTGAAADMLREHESLDFDTLITGEPRQFAYHYAKEHQLNVLFIGHYASETFGVRKLSERIAQEFKLENEFIDLPTGI